MRRASWRSVPSTYSPPSSTTPSPSLMSTPRPAMFVAIVTAPGWPASLMISASRACSFAFRTLCGIPARVQPLGEVLGGLDRDRADEDGLPLRRGAP